MLQFHQSTVLDRQRARMQQQHQQQYSMYYSGGFGDDGHCDEFMSNGWPDLAAASGHAYTLPGFVDAGDPGIATPSGGSMKRKAEDGTKEVLDTNSKKGSGGEKRRKGEGDVQAKVEASESDGSSRKEDLSAGAKKAEAAAPPKQDYIHVRARRGQATDSHSLAERVRREKISERMKYLQELVPGCSKITGKAGMLDEIINYVQSLQKQVEFLSMKLATVNPRIDFNIDQFFGAKEASNAMFPMLGISSEVAEACFLQFNPLLQQANAYYGLDIPMNAPELQAPCPATSAPMSDATFDSCLNANGSSFPWEANIHSSCNVEIDQGKGIIFPFQLLQGNTAPNNAP